MESSFWIFCASMFNSSCLVLRDLRAFVVHESFSFLMCIFLVPLFDDAGEQALRALGDQVKHFREAV